MPADELMVVREAHRQKNTELTRAETPMARREYRRAGVVSQLALRGKPLGPRRWRGIRCAAIPYEGATRTRDTRLHRSGRAGQDEPHRPSRSAATIIGMTGA